MNKKAAINMSVGLIAVMIVAILVVIGTTTVYSKSQDKTAKAFDISGCTKSIDGEESYLIQKNNKDKCPCDIEEVPRYYTLKTEAEPWLKKIIEKYPEDITARLREDDVNAMREYIEMKFKDSTYNDPLELSQELNAFREYPKEEFTPDVASLCPNNPNNCRDELFMEEWFVEGAYGKPSCKTPADVCYDLFVKECGFTTEKKEK